MNASDDSKVCPHCAETIKTAAKVCPHCRYWQKRWSLYNPTVLATTYSVLYLALFGSMGLFVQKAFGPKNDFATYRDEISVVNSEYNCHFSGSNLYVTIIGTLTNASNIGWKEVGVEAQFVDKTGKLIDALPVKADNYSGSVLLPHGNAAFKIEGKAARAESDYGKYSVSVRWAKDVDAMF